MGRARGTWRKRRYQKARGYAIQPVYLREYAIQPVHLYEHSGIAMSVSPFLISLQFCHK